MNSLVEINVFSSQDHIKRGITLVTTFICKFYIFCTFQLLIDLLTLKKTLNHQNNIRNKFTSQIDFEKDIESSKEHQKRILQSKSNKNDVKHLSLVLICICWIFFHNFNLLIDPLPLKMTLDHQNNIRNQFSRENYTKKGITLVTSFFCWKVVFSLIWPWKMAVSWITKGDNVYTQWNGKVLAFNPCKKCFKTNNAGSSHCATVAYYIVKSPRVVTRDHTYF